MVAGGRFATPCSRGARAAASPPCVGTVLPLPLSAAMLAFVLKRLALVVPTFLGITLLVFALIRMIPGDPVEALSGERGMAPERHQRLSTSSGSTGR